MPEMTILKHSPKDEKAYTPIIPILNSHKEAEEEFVIYQILWNRWSHFTYNVWLRWVLYDNPLHLTIDESTTSLQRRVLRLKLSPLPLLHLDRPTLSVAPRLSSIVVLTMELKVSKRDAIVASPGASVCSLDLFWYTWWVYHCFLQSTWIFNHAGQKTQSALRKTKHSSITMYVSTEYVNNPMV